LEARREPKVVQRLGPAHHKMIHKTSDMFKFVWIR